MLFIIIFLSICVIYFLKKFVKSDLSDTFILSILVLPALLYWATDGKLSELTGFGVTAKFANASQKSISTVKTGLNDLVIFSLAGNDQNFRRAAFFENCANYFVVRPSKVPSDENELETYILDVSYALRSSLACGRLVGVIVLDDNDRYLGSYDRDFFSEALSIWAVPDRDESSTDPKHSARILSETIFGASIKFPSERITPGEGFEAAINEEMTLQSAFEKFRETGVDFLVITDATGRFKGILRYRDVVEALLSALLKS